MKKILMCMGLSLMALSTSSYAVDGYKNIKFGSSLDQVKSTKVCTLQPYSDGNDLKGMTQYYCGDFSFSGSRTTAMFFFIDGKFERVAIALNGNINGVYNALKEKYGDPSSQSSMDEVQSMEKSGGTVSIRFDHDSIIMAQVKNAISKVDISQLIYTSPVYAQKYESLQKNAASSDI